MSTNPFDRFNHFEDYVTSKLAWYRKRSRKHALLSKSIKYLSISFLIIASLVPIVQAIILSMSNASNAKDLSSILSNVGYLILAVAGGFNLVDQQFGFSSGYLRFVATRMEIDRLWHEFLFKWYCLTEHTQEGKMLDEALCALILEYKDKIDDEESKETDTWINEFRTNQSELQALLKNKSEAYRKMAEEQKKQTRTTRKGKVTFDNQAGFQGIKILVQKDGVDFKAEEGPFSPVPKSKIITGLNAGSYELIITATDASNNEYVFEEVLDLTTDLSKDLIVILSK